MCIFEFIYFARPDSNLLGKMCIWSEAPGQAPGPENPVEADIVTGIPDSSLSPLPGWRNSWDCHEMGLIKTAISAGRSSAGPGDTRTGVQLKLNPVRQIVAGKGC